ncbi:DVU0772 family protein, partial [Thermodesulfobacteriota bacterium]
KKERELINSIDWEMTPEEAVRLYLEWGNIRSSIRDRYVVRSKNDYTVYFVVNCWSKPYYIYLIKRNSEEALEIARFELPKRFEKPVCELKGVYALEGEIEEWLRKELDVD